MTVFERMKSFFKRPETKAKARQAKAASRVLAAFEEGLLLARLPFKLGKSLVQEVT